MFEYYLRESPEASTGNYFDRVNVRYLFLDNHAARISIHREGDEGFLPVLVTSLILLKVINTCSSYFLINLLIRARRKSRRSRSIRSSLIVRDEL